MYRLLLAPLLLLTVAATDRDADQVEKALAGKVAGAPKNCLTRFEADNMSVHDGVLLFRVSSKLVYRNDMNQCSNLREDDIIQTNLFGSSQLCRGDIARLISRTGGFEHGACSFGDFVPYRTPAN
ncbi:hypothetical protein SPAN111604_03260 [Sphingomonas antarctica]|uniref:hypothetical protein n=1 Tax=Sphingomonas antarctica TaxID=2040274 RepID=UPI0039EC593A